MSSLGVVGRGVVCAGLEAGREAAGRAEVGRVARAGLALAAGGQVVVCGVAGGSALGRAFGL